MQEITKYKDEISGKVFDTAEKAISSEKKNRGIKKLFAFWKPTPKEESCSFSNGSWCYQRTREDVTKYKQALLDALKNYEPWITSQYDEDGGLQLVHLGAGYIIGRYLNDGNSELYDQYCTMSNICPKCFREWGQQYYANNCSCDNESKPLN